MDMREELIKLLALIDSTDFDNGQTKIQMKLEIIRAVVHLDEKAERV